MDQNGVVLDILVHPINEETLNHTTPLYRKHINPFGKYHFDVSRMRNVENTADAASA